MDWGWINDLRIISFHEATTDKPTPEYFLRMVFRWYGQTFGMSPHLVEELPLFDVLRHYFEVQAKDASEDEPTYQRMLRSIVFGDEEGAPQTIAAIEDDEFMQRVKEGAFTQKGASPKLPPKMAPAISLPKAEEPPMPEFEMVDFSELNQMDQAEELRLPPPPGGSKLSRLQRARSQK